MKSPLVSIIIPVYNAEQHLLTTISSATNQTYANIEIIIIDDGSTDASLEIAKSFESPKIRIFTQQKSNAASARNLGLKNCSGDYIQFLDADDTINPEKIQLQILTLRDNPNCVAFGDTIFFYDDTEATILQDQCSEFVPKIKYNSIDFILKLYAGFKGRGSMISVHSWLTPKTVIASAGLWDEALTVDDDGEYFCRIILASKGILYVPGAKSYYRRYKEAKSLSGENSSNAVESKLHSIDLKYNHLLNKLTLNSLQVIFGRFYWELGVSSYPKFKIISKRCIEKSKDFHYSKKDYFGGKGSILINKMFGWKVARLASFYKHGI